MCCRYAAHMAARRVAAARNSSESTANGQPGLPKDGSTADGQPGLPKDVTTDHNDGGRPMPKEEV